MAAMRAGKDTGSLINHLMSDGRNDVPAVGMGATVLSWSDRTACTIVEASDRIFVVQVDKSTRTDGNGMSDAQSYAYEPNPEGQRFTFKRVTRGRARDSWRENGRTDGRGVLIGHRETYHDFSF